MSTTVRRLLAVAFAAVLAVLAVASAQSVTVATARGEVSVPTNPEVVFSYDYDAIDTLTQLGIAVDGAPSLAGVVPAWAQLDVITIGSLFEPDYEVVNAEQPGLIIVGGRSAAVHDELAKLAPTIDLSGSGDLLADIHRNVRTLSAIFGKQAEGEAALAAVDAKITSVRSQVAAADNGMLIMVSGGSLSVIAPDNLRGRFLYDVLGLTPTIADVQSATHGDPISFEFLLEHDPQWLFMIDRDAAIGTEGAQPAAAVLDNELMHNTTAWKSENIVYLDPFNWYIVLGTGLSTVNGMLDEVAAAFQ
ncbi:MAG: ABC transporter substrate-binding protein [Trueperaceae bacterium]|nr:ABC transporter substrate-binding protein [Trueperaceae bacterium]